MGEQLDIFESMGYVGIKKAMNKLAPNLDDLWKGRKPEPIEGGRAV